MDIDPNNEELHRVRTDLLKKYKDGVIDKVVACCGKTWAPEFPVNRIQKTLRCPLCFPSEAHRFSIAK